MLKKIMLTIVLIFIASFVGAITIDLTNGGTFLTDLGLGIFYVLCLFPIFKLWKPNKSDNNNMKVEDIN